MRNPRPVLLASAVVLLSVVTPTTLVAHGATSSKPGSPVSGTACRVFPATNYWHADVRHLPVHPRSAEWLSHMSTDRDLHPDFGPSYGDGPDYGMPVTVVGARHARVHVSFEYADESDRLRYPFGSDTRIEGGVNSGGDMHAIVVDKSTCRRGRSGAGVLTRV